jgi:hypothetical protein
MVFANVNHLDKLSRESNSSGEIATQLGIVIGRIEQLDRVIVKLEVDSEGWVSLYSIPTQEEEFTELGGRHDKIQQ